MPTVQRVDHEAITVLRLDRPERRNAMDSQLLGELLDAMAELAARDDLRALVFSTTSEQALSAGADVAEPLDDAGGVARMEAFTRMYAAVEAFPVPTVAVCVGNVVGAGAELAAGCDLRVGGHNLKLAWAGARHGVPVGPARLMPLVGLSRAKDLVYTGRVVSAGEAEEIGFLNRVVPATRAEESALELAGQVAAGRPEGLRQLKAMFRRLGGDAERVAYENELLVAFQRDGAGLPRG
ncbi:MAG TPA: enoyl-CoA hydratase/isomerase family protein [Thermoleophilaceae bacterium]|nr:enoyl-CoA hydratase/isomerase family protein [Thermoleophilaceae bacterium]